MRPDALNARQQTIIGLLREQGAVTVTDLTRRFDVTAMTVRRDLDHLAHTGCLTRTHGGAIFSQQAKIQFAFREKQEAQLAEKAAIARAAAALVQPGMTVVLDTGTTTLEVARAIAGIANLKVLTSSLAIAAALYARDNIDPGQDGSLEDIISQTAKGILLDGDRSWSIGSNREQFHFGTEIGWLVEDGKVTKPVKNSTYRGDTLKFWNSLSAVGDSSTWELKYVDNCGKGQPNQIMQLGHGVPVCRFDNVRIGE